MEQATTAVDTIVNDRIQNHGIVVENTVSQALTNVPNPENENSAVNLETMNRKTHSEIEINNQLEALTYFRLDGENKMVSILQMNNNRIVSLAVPEDPSHAVNLKTLNAEVNSLAKHLGAESRRYNDQLTRPTNENMSQKVVFLDGTSLPENHKNYNGKKYQILVSRLTLGML